jgi:hypothetical protein
MISPAAAELIRRLASEAILQIRMGCQAYRTGDVLGGELHLSLGQAALLKLHALLDEPSQKPLRRMALVVMPRDEEAELPEWMTKKHGGNDGDAA